MKILYIVELYYPHTGGVEVLFDNLARLMAARGHEVKVLTTQSSKDLPISEIVDGVEIVRIPCSSRFLFTLRAVRPALKMAQWADVVHTTSYNAALPAYLASFVRKKRCLITFHEYWGPLWMRLPGLNIAQRLAFRLFERLVFVLPYWKMIAVSGYTQECLQRAGKKKRLAKIYNGIDNQVFHPSWTGPQDRRFHILYYGRPGVSKGFDLLMSAAPAVLSQFPDAVLHLVLPSRPAQALAQAKQMIVAAGLNDSQLVLEHDLSRIQLIQRIRESSCVVIPSYSEGFCFAAAEASAIGVPIVHSGQGALPEVVSGRAIAMQEHSAHGLEQALRGALAGNWMEIPARRFFFERNADSYEELYREAKIGKE